MSVEVHPSRAHIEPLGNLRPEGSWAPSEHEIELSKAISLKRIADAFDASAEGGRPQGSVLYWLEIIASAANAGRS